VKGKLILPLLLLPFLLSASIQDGIDYLINTQTPHGNWESPSVASFPCTIEVLLTLISLSVEDEAIQRGIEWVKNQNVEKYPYYLSLKIKLLQAIGENVEEELEVLKNLKEENGWGLEKGYLASLEDTYPAISTLPDEDSLSFLLSHQEENGSWKNSLYLTSRIILSLSSFSNPADVKNSLEKACNWLFSQKSDEGAFGEKILYTCCAILALLEFGYQKQELSSSLNYLSSQQEENGSWENDPFITALALRALSKKKPDLKVGKDDISITPVSPQIGQSIHIEATIKNIGDEGVPEGIKVEILVKDVQQTSKIGETTLPALQPGEDFTVSLDWEPSLGEKEIIVSVDPENTLNEWEEDNNSASQRLWVRNLPDLQIDQTDITFSPLFPLGDEEFQIICTIHNRGESSSENVVVAFYYLQNNQPVEIGRTTISRISLGEEKQTQITAVLPYGSYEILVKIDPENSIQESNGENNSATKMLTMTSPMPTLLPDLVVMSEEISFKPESPHDQTNIQLTGKIHNLGGRYAYNVKVSFFDGSPYEEGQEVATVTIHEIPPNGEVPVSAEFNLSAGDHNVFLFADYEDNIIENNEKNNFGIIYIPVRQYVPLPDFVFLDYYALDPDPPLQNHEGKIYIKVKNIGFEPGENVKVWCYGYGWNPNTYQEDDFWVEKVVDKILPGEEKLVEFNYTPHLVTSYQIVCEVNYDYSIEEIQYDNNWYGFSIDVWPESPDLYIREGSLSYNITCTGDLVIHANIENRGNQDVYSVKVEFREESEHGELLGSRIIQVIPARSSKSTSLSLSLSEHKNLRTVYVEVDPDNEINESDEENNSYSISFPGVNLTCLYLTWQWIEGRRVKFSTSIKNYGYFPAAGFSVKFYRGEKFPELIGEEYIELLNPNGTTQAAIEWEVPDGEHVITVIVDADEEINESNEDDNKRACRIDINKPEIYVKSLTFEPEVGEVGEEMIIKVVVRNRGFASATLTRARLHVSLSNTSGCWDSYQEKENLNIELSPDEECTIEFLFTPETWGMGYVYVSIDFHPIDIYEGAYGQRDLVVAYYPPELPADFLVREEGINISDEFPIKGEFLFFYGTIYNPGKDALPPTVAQLFLGGHENGGTQIGEDVEIPPIMPAAVILP